jgi:alkylation response protein AidB-like acyl-CoA dehydrogenase
VNDDDIDVHAFRLRAREWIRANLDASMPERMMGTFSAFSYDEELAHVAHDRALQRQFFDNGFAGICVPREYGGRGLTPAHQRALNEELTGFEHASRMQVPTMTPCLAVLLEFGTDEQKRRLVPPILTGEAIWMQLLSEPSGGSDVAGALTTAVRDGDEWILNGSKVWTTGAWWSDWGMCLARTNWDAPKHRGLTVFVFPLHQPGVEVQQIEMLNGSKEFCQEFLTDLRVPDTDRIGEIDGGWTVGSRWMFHERLLHSSVLVTMPVGAVHGRAGFAGVLDIALDAGRLHDPVVRDLVGEARMLDVVKEQLQLRVTRGLETETLSDAFAAVVRLFHGVATTRSNAIAFEVAGGIGAAWTDDDGQAGHAGTDSLMRQTSQIGGGTTEMARNVIAERVLGMPRERSFDRDVPFRDVSRGPSHQHD